MRRIYLYAMVLASTGLALSASETASLEGRFEPNRGQAEQGVDFLVRGGGYSIALTSNAALMRFGSSAAPVRIELLNSNPSAAPAVSDRLPGVTNYAIGRDSSRWVREVPGYAGVTYKDVYPGVDWVFHNAKSNIEFDFFVAPGAEPASIAFRIAGVSAQHIAPSGNLMLRTSAGEVELQRPRIYQESGRSRSEVPGAFVRKSGNRYGLRVGVWDKSKPLVIDPQIRFATFLPSGGSGIAVDSSGATYIVGTAFPSQMDVYVSKLNPQGTAIVYTTYLGGASDDYGKAIALDSKGNVYITGTTFSSDFPVLSAYQPKAKGNGDAFVAKLDSSGNVVWSTYLGSSTRRDDGTGIAVDLAGNAYVTGTSPGVPASDFPTTSGTLSQQVSGVFVSKFNTNGGLLFSTFLDNPTSLSAAIAVDRNGNSYIATSDTICVGKPGALAGHGGPDAALKKLDPSGATLIYSVCLGGNGVDWASSVALDQQGNAFVAGQTDSPNFPVQNPLQPSLKGHNNGFIAKVNSTGSGLIYSTFLGQDNTVVYAVAVDAAGVAYLVGRASTGFTFIGPSLNAGTGGFFCEIAPSGGSLVYSSPLGIGSDVFSSEMGIAVDNGGSAYLTGSAVDGYNATAGAAATQGFGMVARVGDIKTAVNAVVSSASFQGVAIAPGEIVSLFGTDMGTLTLSAATLVDGFYPTTVSGTQVLFDGTPAPIIFTRSDQIGAVVPYSVAGKTSTRVQVSWQGNNSPALGVPVAGSAPSIFTADGSGTGPAAVLNQDGSLNSIVNPAARGSIIVFYATGAGVMTPPALDGSLVAPPYAVPVLPVTVSINNAGVEILYAGAAPGLISGALQVNIRVPVDAPVGNAVPLVIRVGEVFSPLGVTIAIR